MKKLAFAALATLAAMTSVNAADIGSYKDTPYTMSPVASPAGHFGGAYVGGSINWEVLDVDQRGSLSIETGNESFPLFDDKLPGMSGEDFAGGAQIGYNFEFGRLYVGPVAKFDLGGPSASLNRTLEEGDDDGEGRVTGHLNFDVNWSATLAGKLGWAITDRVGVYGLVGVGFVDADVNGSVHMSAGDSPIGGIGINSSAHSDTLTAFTYGAGVDLKISDQWRGFVEWQRFDLDSFDASGSALVDFLKYGYDGDATLDVVRVGVNYAF